MTKLMQNDLPYAVEMNQFFYRINEVAQMLGISRSRVYELLKEKELISVKEGRKTLITRGSLLALVAKWNRLGKMYT